MTNKEEYYKWIDENDSYPEHSHKFIVALYNTYKGVEAYHRYFGPFDTRQEAKVFSAIYKQNYTKPGFITKTRIFPLCQVCDT